MTDHRVPLLQTWATYIEANARSGVLAGRSITLQDNTRAIVGPRAGVLLLYAGLESGRLLRALKADESAALRQFIPPEWDFPGSPQIFMSGRYIRCEVAWPSRWAEKEIRLGDLPDHPHGGGVWVAGKSETGHTITPKLCDRTPHFLVSGATGSGKSVALRSMVLQLSADANNEIVLIDGKMGESLRSVQLLPNVIAPVATDGPQVRSALGWVCGQMRQRYETGYRDGRRIVCVFDEFQEMVQDAVICDLLRKICAQGRSAGVHAVLATQHPTVAAFGSASTRRNLTGRIALRVSDSDASRVAVGGATPRADFLQSAGDSYAISPGACHRVQLCLVDEQEISAGENGGPSWRFQRYPDYEPEDIGAELPDVGWHYTGDELAVALVAAANNEGRTRMVNRLGDAQLGRPGAERAIRLLRLGRDTNDWLTGNGYAVCLSGDTVSGTQGVQITPDVW